MQIRHVIIKADDQKKAVSFCTSILGFVKKLDFPIGPVRWLTVSSPEGAEDVFEISICIASSNYHTAIHSTDLS